MKAGENMKNLARNEIHDIKPYVPGKPISEVKREYGLDKVVKLASNENPLGPSKKAVEAIKNELDQLNYYPDGYCFELRDKLSKFHSINKDNFCFGSGTNEIIEMLFQAFVAKDDEIVFCHPSFVEYYRYSKIMGAKIIDLPLTKDMKFDLDKILESITDKTKMICICNPNNPIGSIVEKEKVDEFIKKVPENILLVFDEAYFEYAKDYPEYPDSIDYQKQGLKNIVTLRTFSKAYGLAGLRVGYGIADKEIITYIDKVRLPFNVGSLSQKAAVVALDDTEHLENSIEIVKEGKKYIYKEFDDMGIKYVKTYANFLFFDAGMPTQELFQKLLMQGVVVRPMYDNYVRVSFGTMEENKMFIEKLKEVIKK